MKTRVASEVKQPKSTQVLWKITDCNWEQLEWSGRVIMKQIMIIAMEWKENQSVNCFYLFKFFAKIFRLWAQFIIYKLAVVEI